MRRITLTQYLVEQQREKGVVSAELRLLIEVVARACKSIGNAVSKGALTGILGNAGSNNVQGEAQKKLDVISNEVLLEANEWGGHLAAIASEEMEHPHQIPNRYPRGEYLLLMDPLDGSSNIDVNVSIGTIFSVLRASASATEPDEQAFLQPGSHQVCAGYTVYGPQTLLVLSVGHGVQIFTEEGLTAMGSRDGLDPSPALDLVDRVSAAARRGCTRSTRRTRSSRGS